MTSPLDVVLERAHALGLNPKSSGNGFMCKCPAHADTNASLSITLNGNGVVLLHCFADCPPTEVVAALNLTWDQLFPDKPTTKTKATKDGPTRHATFEAACGAAWWGATDRRQDGRMTVYKYWGGPDRLVGGVVRVDFDDGREKEIRRVRRDGDAWICKDMKQPRPLYNLRAALAEPQARTIVVEGEKVVDALAAIGVMAVTSCGGANAKLGETDWSPLKDRLVIVAPDNDSAGNSYADRVIGEAWRARALAVQTLRIPGLPEGGDLADWIDEQRKGGLGNEAIRARFDAARAEHAQSTPVGSGAPPDRESPPAADPFEGRWFDSIDETWTEQEPPTQRWLVCEQQPLGLPAVGILARGVVGLLAGAGGIGKTEVVANLAIAICTGGLWLDCYPVDDCAGRVLLLVAEEDEEEMRRRVHRLTRRLAPDERAALRGRLVIVPMHGRSVALLSRSSKSAGPERTAFLAALRARLDAEAGPDGWAAIIIGPLSRLAGVAIDADNENATALVQALETLTELPGNPTVLVDCHTPATARKRDATIEDVRPRGPTGLWDGVRWAAALHRPGKRGTPLEFAVTKANRSPDDLPALQLERGDDGVLRCVGEVPTADDRREQHRRKVEEQQERDAEERVTRVVATLRQLYGAQGEPIARETIATNTRGKVHLNRTAVDVAHARGLIRHVAGTASRPLFAPADAHNTSRDSEGGTPPHTPGTGRDVSVRSAQPVRSRPGTEWDGLGRNGRDGLDDAQPERPKGRRRRGRRKA